MNESGITPFALGFMLASMISVTVLVAYCFIRIMRGGRPLHGENGDPDS
jgi:hypothetical protein